MIPGIPGKQSPAIRVLLGNVAPELEAWLAQVVEGQDDIEIVDQLRGYVETLMAAQQGVDVVVLSAHEFRPPPGICSHLLSEHPDIKVLLISPSGDKAMLCWTGLHQKELQIVSAEMLVDTLRQLDSLTQSPA